MTRTQIFEHVNEKYSVTPDYPWEADTSAVLRYPQNNKWFALMLGTDKAKGEEIAINLSIQKNKC